jgi:hypothetical protein
MTLQHGLALPVALACSLALAACGSKKTGDSLGSNPNDQRAQALQCMQDDGLAVRKVGNTSLQVGDRPTDPRVVFYTTPRDAEADQFEGKSPGAEQVGRALIYVNEGSDEVLEKLENCLDETT